MLPLLHHSTIPILHYSCFFCILIFLNIYYVIHLTSYGRIAIFNSIGNKESLSRKISIAIENAIITKRLITGEKLPSELELCTQFGVSRTAVREALQMLSAKGLISIEKGRGIFVTGFSPDTVTAPLHTYLQFKSEDNLMLDVVRARMIIEPPIAEQAALNRDDDDIKLLKQNFEEMKANSGLGERHSALDLEFHLKIAEASKNYIMPLIIQPIHKLMPVIKTRILASVPDAYESAVTWHKKILDAIIDKDPKRAYETMKQHLEIALEHTNIMLKAEEHLKDKSNIKTA